jgi:peptide/bleomycin uptake transporter
MFRSYFLSWKWAPYAYGGAFFIYFLLWFQVEIASWFANWMEVQGNVVSGAQKYSNLEFLGLFIYEALKLVSLLIATGVVLNYVSRKFCWYWFEALVFFYLPNWNKTLRDVERPAQRLHESTNTFVLKLLGMTKALIFSAIAIKKFGPKLWEYSSHFNFFSFGHISGLLVWIVIVICSCGFIISMLIGINLKKCKYDIADAAGQFRSGLEHMQRNKNRDDSIPNLEKLMAKMRKTNFRLFYNQFWYEIWIGIYSQFWVIAPITFFGYNVFAGYAKYGPAQKAQNSLGEFQRAVSMPIWLWDDYAELMSVVQRLRELEEAIDDPENWKESKKEEGWKDRRAEPRTPVYFVDPLFDGKVELTEEEVAIIRESIKSRPHIWE